MVVLLSGGLDDGAQLGRCLARSACYESTLWSAYALNAHVAQCFRKCAEDAGFIYNNSPACSWSQQTTISLFMYEDEKIRARDVRSIVREGIGGI